MNKKQHYIKSLIILFAIIFVFIDLAGLAFSFAMQPSSQFLNSWEEGLKVLGYYSMIPISILFLLLSKKYSSNIFIYLAIVISMLHIFILFKDQL